MEQNIPKLPENQNQDEASLDPVLRNYYVDIKKNIMEDHNAYIQSHPEIRQILNDYMSSLLLHKPDDVFKFTKDYFSFFNKKGKEGSEEQPAANDIKPLIIVGPSGVGKGTITKKLFDDYPDRFAFSVSYATRQPRPGEEHGKHYFFVTPEEFHERVASNDFLEHVEYSGNLYGTSKSYIDSLSDKNQICILDIDLLGAEKLIHRGFDCNVLFLFPPSVDELYARLIARGHDSAEAIEKRINKAKHEMEEAPKKTFIQRRILNDNVDACFTEVKLFLSAMYPSLKF